MVIIETPRVTRRLAGLVTDDEYRAFQIALMIRPDLGAVLKRTGGARKVRMAVTGRGKRGGARVIYYWAEADAVIYLLMVYAKNEADTLTRAQEHALAELIRTELK